MDLIAGIALITNDIYLDERGYFFEKYNRKFLSEKIFLKRSVIKIKQKTGTD
jgi:dTDP-4-dehydrorhamnose 3,5-epimerase-like enzyme